MEQITLLCKYLENQVDFIMLQQNLKEYKKDAFIQMSNFIKNITNLKLENASYFVNKI